MDARTIFELFQPDSEGYHIKPFGSGLIHHTFCVEYQNEPVFILQHINKNVFRKPEDIEHNLDELSKFLETHERGFLVPFPLKTPEGKSHAVVDGEFYRLTRFVPDSFSLNECTDSIQAFQAAYQFGNYTAAFNGFDSSKLIPSIPGFHDLAFRWSQFEDALKFGNAIRINFASKEIQAIQNNYHIVEKFLKIQQSTGFLNRVTHHDTKINNVLFNKNGESICVIDLDTTMSGLIISDLGDMFRTYLAPGNEEETDLSKVYVREDFLKAIIAGYAEKMSDFLTNDEKSVIGYAGEFMIFMQALRFLTDFLNDDIYYGIKYELNNYNRTLNQLHLLTDFQKHLGSI